MGSRGQGVITAMGSRGQGMLNNKAKWLQEEWKWMKEWKEQRKDVVRRKGNWKWIREKRYKERQVKKREIMREELVVMRKLKQDGGERKKKYCNVTVEGGRYFNITKTNYS